MTGVFVPAGTPKPIVELLQREIAAIVNAPDMKAGCSKSASRPKAIRRPTSRPMCGLKSPNGAR